MVDPPIPAQYKIGKIGNKSKVLVDDQGYTYSNPATKLDNVGKTWRCSKKTKKCKATITTENDWVVAKRHKHNHEPPENSQLPVEPDINFIY